MEYFILFKVRQTKRNILLCVFKSQINQKEIYMCILFLMIDLSLYALQRRTIKKEIHQLYAFQSQTN